MTEPSALHPGDARPLRAPFPADIDRLAARLEETLQAAVVSLAASSQPGDGPAVVPMRADRQKTPQVQGFLWWA